jgi:hypothetical protein
MKAGVSEQDGISGYLKCQISQGVNRVTGYIGEGSSKTFSANWTSPFESDTAGKAAGLDKAADVGQTVTGLTSVGKLNSTMVWEGSTPPAISLTLYFQAHSNPKREVHDAIMMLEQFASPQLLQIGGQPPDVVTIDIGRRIKIPAALITEVTSELDQPRDSNGYMTRNTVQLTITPPTMVNASEIPDLYV